MTYGDYILQLDAARLRQADEYERMAQAAIYQRSVTFTKGNQYAVQKASDLFDMSRIEEEVFVVSRMNKEVYRELYRRAERVKEWRAAHGN